MWSEATLIRAARCGIRNHYQIIPTPDESRAVGRCKPRVGSNKSRQCYQFQSAFLCACAVGGTRSQRKHQRSRISWLPGGRKTWIDPARLIPMSSERSEMDGLPRGHGPETSNYWTHYTMLSCVYYCFIRATERGRSITGARPIMIISSKKKKEAWTLFWRYAASRVISFNHRNTPNNIYS